MVQKWFENARFGIYVHYGLYSLLQRGEWTMYSERIPAAEYAVLSKQFNPHPDAAKYWCEAAVKAGAGYIVLTTRHHEGFSLFDSRYSDFTSAKSPCRRDIVGEYVEAARAAGLRVGLYYSLLDWRYPGYFEPERYPDSASALVEYIHKQVRELMTGYGKIDLLEYDGGWSSNLSRQPGEMVDFWRSRELNAMVRQAQPEIMINNRSGLNEDIDTPEQVVTASAQGRAWESCMCIGDSCGWGYTRFNPNWKTSAQLIQYLVSAAVGAGNYLLNIGPAPDGSVRGEELTRLQAIGDWLRVNGEAIHGSGRCELIGASEPNTVDLNLQGPWTRRGNTGYWCIFRWPGKKATAIRVATKVKRVSILGISGEFPFRQSADGHLYIENLPENPPDPLCTVIKVEFESEPKRLNEADLSAWLG